MADDNITTIGTVDWQDNQTIYPPNLRPLFEDAKMHLVRLICEVWISFPIAVLGIIGNVMAFVVLSRQQRLTTTVLLQALAVADTLVLVSSVLLRSLRYIGWDAYNSVYHFIFLSVYPFVYFFRLADTWLTVMLTIDRFIAVCHPLKAQRICTLRRTYISIAVIMLSTFLFSLPRFFEYRLVDEYESINGFIHTSLLLYTWYSLGYRVFVFFVVMYLIPMVILTVLNIRLMYTLKKSITHRASMITSNIGQNGTSMMLADQKANISVTVVVGTVVTVCILCNITAMVSHVLWSIQLSIEGLRYLEYHRRFLANASNVLVTFNCAINFVIYCLFSRKFRVGLRETCRCGKLSSCCHDNLSRQPSSTMATSYTSLIPLRVSIKNHRLTIQHKGNL